MTQPTNPYATPVPQGDFPPPPPMPLAPQTRAPRQGFAITALVLGTAAISGSTAPLLNYVTIVAGVVGVIFGVIALFGAHRVMAGCGTALAVIGIAAGIAMEVYWSTQFHQIENDLSVRTAPPTYRSTAPSTSKVAVPPLKPDDFTVALKVVSKQCFDSYGCNLEVEPTVTYKGTEAELTQHGRCNVTYSVSGNKGGDAIDTAYGKGGTNFDVRRTLVFTASSKVVPAAAVTDVRCS